MDKLFDTLQQANIVHWTSTLSDARIKILVATFSAATRLEGDYWQMGIDLT